MFSGISSGVPSKILKESLGKISLETFVEFLGEILELSLEERVTEHHSRGTQGETLRGISR